MAKQKITFEQALEQLEQIVTKIEQGQISLEQSIEKYAEGIEMIKQCREILDAAEKKIQLLTKGQDQLLHPAGELDEQPPSPDAG